MVREVFSRHKELTARDERKPSALEEVKDIYGQGLNSEGEKCCNNSTREVHGDKKTKNLVNLQMEFGLH